MTDDEIIALKYQHGIEASVPPDVTRSALKQFLACAVASHIESDMNIMAVCTHTGLGFVIYNRTSDMPCPYAEDVLCECVIVQHRFGGLCTVRFTDNKGIFTVGVVHQDDDEIKRFTKYATAWYKKPSRITPANPEPMPNRRFDCASLTKLVLYKERMERARMMALFFDVLCNHEKAVYRSSRYSVRGVALAFDETISLEQVAHTPEEWCHIW